MAASTMKLLFDNVTLSPSSLFWLLAGSTAFFLYVLRQAFPRPYPGIPYHPASARKFWGDVSGLMEAVKMTQDPAKYIFQQNRILKSPVAQLFLAPFSKPNIIIDDVREVKDILSNRTLEFDRAPRTQDAYRDLLPHCSLVKKTGPAFKSQRQFWEGVTGTLFLRRVAEPKIYRCAVEVIELFEAQAAVSDGRPFECFDNFDVAAFELIWEVVFGESGGNIKRAKHDVLEAVGKCSQPPSRDSPAQLPVVRKAEMSYTVSFFISTIAKSLKSVAQKWHLWYLQNKSDYRQRLVFKNGTIDGLIEKTRARLAKMSEEELTKLEESSTLVAGVRRQLLLQIRQGGPGNVAFSPKVQVEIHDELFMILVAGHETKAVLLSWCVKYLVAYPQKQEKLRKALTDALPARLEGEQPSMEAVLRTSLPYLDAYMEESIRVSNTSPRLVRTTTTKTQVLGYVIPKGATVLLNPYVGTLPLELPESARSSTSTKAKGSIASYGVPVGMDTFEPERWLNEDGSFDPRRLPRLGFSAGPRMCYGRNLALLEIRMNLVLLVLNFHFGPLPKGLDSMESEQRLFRMPRQCYVRLTPL